MQHHSQRLSCAAVMGYAQAIRKKIAALKQQACFVSRRTVSVSLGRIN
jgi:hypothetical protein